jgi:hypothetical protein
MQRRRGSAGEFDGIERRRPERRDISRPERPPLERGQGASKTQRSRGSGLGMG